MQPAQPAQPTLSDGISLDVPVPSAFLGPPYYKVVSHADQYRDKVMKSGEPATWYAPWTIETYSDPACTKPLPTKYEVLTPDIYTWYCQTCDKYDCEHTIMVGREVEKQMDEFCKTTGKKEVVPPTVPEELLKKVADAHDLDASDAWWTKGPIHNPPCTDEDCFSCAASQCPYQDPLHHHHDECPSCYTEATKVLAEEPQDVSNRMSP